MLKKKLINLITNRMGLNGNKLYFLSFYVIWIIISLLMILNYQNIALEAVPEWDELYLIVNAIIFFLLASALYSMFSHRLKLAQLTLAILASVWIFYLLMIIIIATYEPLGGAIYRVSFTTFAFITILYRIVQLKALLKLNERY